MGHVIEHVADSRSVLRRAHELLNAGGMLWLAYPNPESISLGVFSSAWQPLHPPFHICIISQKQIKKMLNDAGFENVTFLKRGTHLKKPCALSYEIAEKENILSIKHRLYRHMYGIIDFISAYSCGYADETVVIAQKRD